MPVGGLTTGPRNLLRQIREAMAGASPAQDRLDTVVRIIAQSMVAEVCSIYLRRASGELELFATQGLNPSAVHRTRLRVGGVHGRGCLCLCGCSNKRACRQQHRQTLYRFF